MARGLIIFFLFSLTSVFLSAQTATKITGMVRDISGNGLPTVGVAVLNITDSSLVKTDITETDGSYDLAVPGGGTFLVRYTLSHYATVYNTLPAISTGNIFRAPDVVLVREETKLNEVTFVAKKPMIEMRADKLIFNVENSINATGSNALELLQKSPGVLVDNNENISMKGKNGVKVYIDGRMTQLGGKELAAYLKNIGSNDIESIEMISNPSAKYDASGNAGIINFRLKKNKKFGTNGSVNLTFTEGITPRANGSVNLNYRDRKINVFGNFSASGGRNESGLDLDRIQKDTSYLQKSVTWYDSRNVNFKTGIDYFASRRQTIGFLVTSNISDKVATGLSHTGIYAAAGGYIKTLTARNNSPESRTNSNINLNYKFTDSNGRELNVDADYGLFRGRGQSWQPNYYTDANNQLLNTVVNRNYTPINIDIYTAKADWEQRMGKGTLGIGGKIAFVTTANTFDFYNDVAGTPVKVLERSNAFRYTENVNAAYINYNNNLSESVSLQAGLRLENTASRGELTRADGTNQADDTVVRDYTNLFPSAALTWNVSRVHTLNLTYSRRIDRPSYQDLNPFESKIDELTYQKGNAFLRPQFTNTIELTHIFMGLVNTSVGYSHVYDYANDITDTIRNATYVQTQNVATQQIVSVNVSSSLPIKKWWSGYGNLWVNYQVLEGQIGNNIFRSETPMYGAYLQQNFILPKNYSVEVSGKYNGPSVWGGTWQAKSSGNLDLGAQKRFFSNNATLKVSITDIFRTSGWRAHNHFGGQDISGRDREEVRTLRVSFSYRFGSRQVANARQRQTGLESERGRIK